MGIVRRLRALLRRDREQNGAEPMPFSLVLLMRKPFLVSKPMLEAAGSAAFGVPYDGSDPMYFVVQEGATMMKAGPYVIHVLHKWGAYLGATEDDTETGASLLPEPQRALWREQRAWASFDLWNEDVPESQAVHGLSSLVLRLIDERCCGIWIPSQARFLPNDDSAEHPCPRIRTWGTRHPAPRHYETPEWSAVPSLTHACTPD